MVLNALVFLLDVSPPDRGVRVPHVVTRCLAACLLGSALISPPAHALTLDEAFEAAERDNIELALSAEQLEQAKAQQWQAFSAHMPRLSATMGYRLNQDEIAFDPGIDLSGVDLSDNEDVPEAFVPVVETLLDEVQAGLSGGTDDPLILQAKQAWNGVFSVAQPLLNGRAIAGYMAAEKMRDAAEADHRRVRGQIRASVAQVYYSLLTSQAALEVQQTAEEIAQHQLDLAQRQVAIGLAERRVQLQAELGAAKASRDVLQAREQLIAAQEAFHQVTGLARDSQLELPDPMAVPETIEAALRQGLSARPDVEAAEHRVLSVKRQRLMSDMGWVPTVDLYMAEIYNQVPGFIGRNWQWQLGLNFNWDLFDGGMRIHTSRERASQVRQAQLLVKQVEQRVEQDVRTSWQRFDRAQAALASVDKELELAREYLRLSELGFAAGTATWLDVENARASLAGSELAHIQERMQRDLAAISLLLAVGDL